MAENSFELFLRWLDPDREEAGKKYEEIRKQLISFFKRRPCTTPEELADETFDRVMRSLPKIVDRYEGEPIRYIYAAARSVFIDYIKRRDEQLPKNLPDRAQTGADLKEEERHECLRRCLQKLTPDDRELALKYYQGDKRAKIDHRQSLAEELGIGPNALRIRMHRLRALLQGCMEECLKENIKK